MAPKLDNTIFEQLTETYLMALCIWAEARNQGLEGMQAVGSVILNRASKPGWWGHDIKSVILQPKQFSWLNEDDPQRIHGAAIAGSFIETLQADATLRACVWVAAGLLGSPLISQTTPGGKYISSNVGAATHYHTEAAPAGTTKWPPAWAGKMKFIGQIKDHLFYV